MLSDLAPGLLVAAPKLIDPSFYKSVVLLINHRQEGSLGFIINRLAETSLSEVAHDLKFGASDSDLPDLPVLVGGPVMPQGGWIIYDDRYAVCEPKDDTISVTPQVRVSASRDLLRLVVQSSSTKRHLLVLGYAGWGSGQLDREIRQGLWIPADIDASILFDIPYEERWWAALHSLGIDPMNIVHSQVAEA